MNVQATNATISRRVSIVLRAGYLLSFAWIAVGVIVAVVGGHSLPNRLPPPADLVAHFADGKPDGLIGVGIACMLLTPLVMTIDTALTFLRSGDRRYALITGAVVLVLIASFVIALTGG